MPLSNNVHGVAQKVGTGYVRYPFLLSAEELNPYLAYLAPTGWRFYHFEPGETDKEIPSARYEKFLEMPVWEQRSKSDCWLDYLLAIDTWKMPRLKWEKRNGNDHQYTEQTFIVDGSMLEVVEAELIKGRNNVKVAISFHNSTDHNTDIIATSIQSAKDRTRAYIKERLELWHGKHLRVFAKKISWSPVVQERCVFVSCACVSHYIFINAHGFAPFVHPGGDLAGKFIGEIIKGVFWEEKSDKWIADNWNQIMEMINDPR